MYIKSITIDGFKSYGQKTVVSGFDPCFNAITGLNGSGKSNILDSICFLLGITNLSQVRASNLQELVYKNGQAGITKAVVSILFDNRDKEQSPVGYQQYDEFTVTRQVVVGGRNKYLINGNNATTKRVQDLFQSVQLNVNNPHFLIMQGRITKVLNMKPPEILAMIEEATGTRMYETKKQSAQKTIEKKDAKLKEIETVLAEDITPTLERLKAERLAYMEFMKVSRELEHLSKFYLAWKFVKTQSVCEKSSEALNGIKQLIASHKDYIDNIQRELKGLKEQISLLEKKKDEEAGGALAQLEAQLKEHRLIETKLASDVDHVKDSMKQENKNKASLNKNYTEDSNAMKNKSKDLDKLNSNLAKLEEADKNCTTALNEAQKHFQAVSAGLSSNDDGNDATIAEQLMVAKSDIARLETEGKQAEMKLQHAQEEVKKKQLEIKKTENSYKQDQLTFNKAEKELEKLKAELAKLDYQESREEALLIKKRMLTRETDSLQEKVDILEARFPHLIFDYQNPHPNFDRRKVHGLVCQLITVKNSETATALEVIAGGRLYNVVVDTEITGKQLLEKGQLKRRYTIIPLNKIQGRTLESSVVKKAENLVGSDNVTPALRLVGYNDELVPAMKYIFGSAFVCPTMDVAQKVAFGQGIQTKSVTLDGDVFDPSGTLTGGSRARGECVLLKLAELKDHMGALSKKRQQLREVESQLEALRKVSQTYQNLKHQIDTKEGEVEILKTRLQQGTHHQQLEEVNRLQQVIADETATVKRCEELKRKAEDRAKDLEFKIKNAKLHREKELKAAENLLKKCRTEAEEASKTFRIKQQEVEVLQLEIEDLQKGIKIYEEQINSVDVGLQKFEEQLASITESLTKAKQDTAKIAEEINQKKASLKAQDNEINKLNKQYDKHCKDMEEKKLAIQQLQHDIERTENESKEAKQNVQDMLDKYEWIHSEKQYFGVPNSEYDFAASNPNEVNTRINKLKETKDKLSKNVNMRTQNMSRSKIEDEYQALLKKKSIVENDKAKIVATIKDLDERKNKALKDAWEKVNADFGSIFSTLLPGAQAKLVPPEGMTVLDGLEFKVGFGNVWKESLSELSGGQRSLVALSLILSLLLFKPAPIYILDEVDAALDLSHTQNIGQMLRNHFKHSQFIVVSLKEGMFNNANVLFRTEFVDGMSTVSCIAQASSVSNRQRQ